MEEEKILKKLLEHDEQLKFIRENMVTKREFRGLHGVQDKMMSILQRLDRKRI